MRFENIPYRTWERGGGIFIPLKGTAYHRVMKHVDKAMKDGKAVDMEHKIVNPEYKGGSKPYDVISVTIED